MKIMSVILLPLFSLTVIGQVPAIPKADSIDLADAQKRGVPVLQIQFEKALQENAALKKQIGDLRPADVGSGIPKPTAAESAAAKSRAVNVLQVQLENTIQENTTLRNQIADSKEHPPQPSLSASKPALVGDIPSQIAVHLKTAQNLTSKGEYKAAFDEVEAGLALNSKDQPSITLREEIIKKDIFGEIIRATNITEVKWDKVAISVAIEDLKKLSKRSIFVNWASLKFAGVDQNTLVSGTFSNVPLDKMLSTILDQASPSKLGVTVDGVVVIVASRLDLSMGRYNPTMQYDVTDLIAGARGQQAQVALNTLEKTIKSKIEPNSWVENGGTKTMTASNNILTIQQSTENQRQITILLRAMRKSSAPTK